MNVCATNQEFRKTILPAPAPLNAIGHKYRGHRKRATHPCLAARDAQHPRASVAF